MNTKEITVRGLTLGDGTPKICIPVTAVSRAQIEQQVSRILAGTCHMIEWRVDYYTETGEADWLPQTLSYLRGLIGDMPLLFTFRTREEGGERSIPMEQYREWNVCAAASGYADFVDLELNRGEVLLQETAEEIHRCGKYVIASFHDFQKTPERGELIGILCRMQELGADISKAAVMPQRDRDVLTLLDATLAMKEQYADRPYITMAMSARGGISRLCGSLTGSALTFATAGCASAPGQMDAKLVEQVIAALCI